MRAAVDDVLHARTIAVLGDSRDGCPGRDTAATRTASDVAEAGGAIERLAAAPTEGGLALRDVWLLWMRALLARARGDDVAYADFRGRYRDMAKSLGYERGVMDSAEGDALTQVDSSFDRQCRDWASRCAREW